jgi:hypothetical protein
MGLEDRVYSIGPKLKFTLTSDHLIEEGSRGSSHWRQAWPLQQLSPEIERQSGRPRGTREALIAGLVMLGAGLTIYFSDLNARAPLLAPVISVVALIMLGRVLQNFRLETWTTIRKWDGTMATSFTHRDCHPGERALFEEAFAETVRHVRRRHGTDD